MASSFLLPRLSADFAEQLHPAPVAADFWRHVATEMKGADGHSESDQRILELKRKTLAQYGVSRVEDLPVNFEGLRLQAGEEHGNEGLRPSLREVVVRLRGAGARSSLGGRLLPAPGRTLALHGDGRH
jgi:hypothetical protein